MPNRLANETSPYLLQHADNPVDWYPWGEEAFARAREEEKPILLSVGYSSCHWCHVMAHESFEDSDIAARMNDWFVNIKVDREERPDVDGVYMTVLQAMTGAGGWPMTVFLTPQLEPFYAGTYYPPQDLHGRPGFPRVLEALNNAWENEREKVVEQAQDIARQLREATSRGPSGEARLDPSVSDEAVNRLRDAFDPEWGGFGQAPKFPAPSNLDFLLAYHARKQAEGQPDPGALYLVTETLRHMASGGVYDQLGGGFARYSVDAAWVVPHFEKMLYDNAQLVRTYTRAWQLTGNPEFERVVHESLAFLQREMFHEQGGFYSALDADSEGIEGKYYVWTVEQVEEVLGKDDAALFNRCFGVTSQGNFHDPHHPDLTGRNVLTARYDAGEVASEFNLEPGQLDAKLQELRQKLFEARNGRVRPGLDDKVLASWNGLVLAAFAEAGRVFRDDRYLAIANRNATFLRDTFWKDGRLLHSWKDGEARIQGMLEDYAYLGLGLVELYKATGIIEWLQWARELHQVILDDFRDETNGAFFETPRSGERLLFDQKSYFDAATPSGNGAAAMLSWWLGRYYDTPGWEGMVSEVVAQVQQHLLEAPSGFGVIWQAIELTFSPRQELVIVGDSASRQSLAEVVADRFIPWLVIAPGDEGTSLRLFEGRESGPGAQAYLCVDMACQLPVTAPVELGRQLDQAA